MTIKLRNEGLTNEEKQEIINGHLRLLSYVASKRYGQYTSTDVFQESIVVMMEALNKAGEALQDNNLTGYLMYRVNKGIKKMIAKQSLVRMPVRTLRHYLQKGINPKKQLLTSVKNANIDAEFKAMILKLPINYQEQALQEVPNHTIQSFDAYIKDLIYSILPMPKGQAILEDNPRVPVQFNYHVPTSKDQSLSDLKEMLRLSTISIREQAIINFRAQGMTYKEVGERMGYDFTRVGQIIRQIEERFDELNK